ncbi:hypothetical protein CHS0354_000740 [Potamilus streckersoni]|uniref:PNPLA domain-containing protein n=1 Tax=Potamilus streckersoni TaxID=2493646 RepID=A0AAE0T843_9BIVA|nr:hypothetical protein CHS0354_000740 [Potamilus streckersoni]
MASQLIEKLSSNTTPKKILSLDGGGVRGILTLGILKEIETLIKEKYGEKTSLGDYYDLMCGTSTGAIIASGLAIGKKIFGKGRKYKLIPRDWTSIRAFFIENYSSTILESYLENKFRDITLGDDSHIKCGLTINTKRADTHSLWVVTNHPNGKYFEANAHLKLWELCRASSAAPYYFKPKILQFKRRNLQSFDATFIDGGVSLANNPAWISFLVATIGTFGFNWNTGTNNLLITSIGTGYSEKKENPEKLAALKALSWAPKLSDLIMTDALKMDQILLGGIGKNIGSNHVIDNQLNDPAFPPQFHIKEQLFNYERHNVTLKKSQLDELGFNLTEETIDSLKELDYYENMNLLYNIGRKYASTATFNMG